MQFFLLKNILNKNVFDLIEQQIDIFLEKQIEI